MKKRLFLGCISLFSVTAFAQNGFFLQPVAGVGAANVSHVDYTGHATSDHFAVNFDGGLLAGYHARKWVFNTGLLYLRTGSKATITITDNLGDPIGTSYLHFRFGHIVLPLQVGRAFAIGKKLTLTPSAGVGLAYNISSTEKDDLDNMVEHVPAGEYNTYDNHFGCYGLLQAEFAWHINPKFDLTCAPTFNYMLTKMIFPQLDPNVVYQHDYSLLLNVGIKWRFAKKEKQADKK